MSFFGRRALSIGLKNGVSKRATVTFDNSFNRLTLVSKQISFSAYPQSASNASRTTPAKESIDSKKTGDNDEKTSNTRQIVLASLILAGAAYIQYDSEFRQDCQHWFKIAKRSLVVADATMKCLVRYRNVLKASYASEKDKDDAFLKCHAECANITYHALLKNGGIYIKLGQHISAMTYLLPIEWVTAMIPLQDQCPRSSIEEINQLFIDDCGKPIDTIFEEFDENPIGIASLAQVHVAKYNGEQVAVKVQHPSLREFVPLDIMLTNKVFNVLKWAFPNYDLTWLSDELQKGIYIELDFNIELINSQKTKEYFKNFKSLTHLRVPEIYQHSKRFLIMEFLPGARLDDLTYIDSHNISRSKVSNCLAHIFNNMIFTPNVGIHCDPHGGNLAIKALANKKGDCTGNFEIILYDHGQYRTIETGMRRSYAKMWLALLDNKPEDVKKYAKEFAGITDVEFPLFAAAITGRDYTHAINGELTTSTRGPEEVSHMKQRFSDGDLLDTLMDLLAHLPKIVLLILKTNDLVRSLDENLQNPMGMKQGFLIMASYCAKTIYQEDLENIESKQLSTNRFVDFCKKWCLSWNAWWSFEKRVVQLSVYELVVALGKLKNQLLSCK